MTFEDFDKLTEDTFDIIRSLRDKKGKEYAHSTDDRLDNFKRIAKKKGVTPIQVASIFLDKHLDVIDYYTTHGKVESDEPIEGRIDDAITYLLLIKGLIVEAQDLDIYKFAKESVRVPETVLVERRPQIKYGCWRCASIFNDAPGLKQVICHECRYKEKEISF